MKKGGRKPPFFNHLQIKLVIVDDELTIITVKLHKSLNEIVITKDPRTVNTDSIAVRS